MAFNAGSIEATLDLDRNPFNRGLQAARRDAQKFAREKFEVRITPKLDKADLRRIKQEIERVTGNIKVKVSLDNASLQAVKQRIDRTVGNIRVKLDLDQAALRAKLAALKVTVNVNLKISRAELLRIKREIEALSPTIRIRLRYDRSQLEDLIRRLREASNGVRNLGNNSDRTFGGMGRTLRAVLVALPLLLPVAAAAINGVIGLLGGLLSILGVVGAGLGALAIVAIPAFKKIKDAVSGGAKEINKLPPGLKQAALALKGLEDQVKKLGDKTNIDVGYMFAAAFNAATTAIKPLVPLIKETAKGATDGLKAFQKYFNSDQYKGFVSFVTDNIRPAMGKLLEIILNSVKAVFNLVQAFWPLGSWLLDKINQGVKDFADWTGKLAKDPAFHKWMETAKQAIEAFWHLLVSVSTFIAHLVEGFGPLGTKIVEFVSGLFDALNKIPPDQLAAIVAGITGVFTAMAFGASAPVALGVGALFAAGVALSNLYDTNEKVRKSIDGFVGYLKKEWEPLWARIKDNFTKYIQPAWDKLVKTFNEVIPPAFEKVKKAYEEHIKPTLGPLVDSLTKDLIPAFLDFANVVLPHVVDALVGFVTDMAAIIGGLITVFSGAFTLIGGLFTTFAGLFSGDWEKFGKGLEDIGRGFLTIIAGLFGTSYDDLLKQGQQFETDMDNWWAGFWGGMIVEQDGSQKIISGSLADWGTASQNNFKTQLVDPITNLWNGFWDGLGRKFDEFAPWLERRTGELATGIKNAWHAVANFFKDPINWVIDIVINKGILGAWNTVMGWIGQPALKADLIPMIPGYATGGKVSGPGTGTSDSVLARVSKDEFIVNARMARQHENFLRALNSGQAEAIQAAGGANNPSFQAGGPVSAGLDFARAQQGKPYVWGATGPGGYDCSGFMSAISNVLTGRYPYSRVGTTASAPWPGWARGLSSAFGVGWYPPGQRGTGHMAGTLAGNNVESGSGHGPLVGPGALGATNFPSAMSLPQVGGQFIGGGPGGGSQVSWWSVVGSAVQGLMNGLLNFTGLPGADSPIGKGIASIPTALVGKVVDTLKKKLEALMTWIGGGPATGTPGDPSIEAAVRAVATSMGWGDGAQWEAIRAIVSKESGWNPLAANPTSSARGLFQKMTSIHGPVEGTPEGQAGWGLNYIRNRYGTPTAAWAFHQAHGYYDNGGLLPPGMGPVNTSNRVERILSPEQTADFHALVGMLSQLVGPGGVGGGDTINVMLPAGASVRELANEIDFRKRVSAKGRYAPR